MKSGFCKEEIAQNSICSIVLVAEKAKTKGQRGDTEKERETGISNGFFK